MPIYAYKCKKCEHEYEIFYKSYSETEETEDKETCPKCDSTDKEKLVNKGTSFQLKGTGWARDRYK